MLNKLQLILSIAWVYWKNKNSVKNASLMNYFAILGITLGVCAIIFVSSIMNGLENDLKQKNLSRIPHMIVSNLDNMQLLQRLKTQENIIDVVPVIDTKMIIQSDNYVSEVKALGVDYKKESLLLSIDQDIVAGHMSSLNETGFFIIIPESLADILQVQLYDKVKLISTIGRYTALGVIPIQKEFIVSGIYQNKSVLNQSTVYIDIDQLYKLTKIKNSYRVYAKAPFDLALQTQSFQYLLQNDSNINFWFDEHGSFFRSVKMEKKMIGLLLVLVIIVAIFNMTSALMMTVVFRQYDIAILRTLGLSKVHIIMICILQNLFSSLIGLLLGVSLGVCLTVYFNAILSFFEQYFWFSSMYHFPIKLESMQIMLLSFFILLCSILSAVYPAINAIKTPIVKVLRYE